MASLPMAIVAAVLLISTVSAFGQAGTPGIPGPPPAPAPAPVLRVMGQAEVSAEPDMAAFDIGGEVHDPSASKAMSELARISDGIVAALTGLDIPRANIQTVQLSLSDQQEVFPLDQPGVTVGPNGEVLSVQNQTGVHVKYRRVYVATHTLHVEIGRDRFSRIGDYLDAAMKAGANSVGGISFGIKDDTPLRKEGLDRAVKNAREKADVMAAAAGVRIRGVQTLEEGGLPRPVPVVQERMAFAAAAPAPVPPSEIRRTYSVTVEYRID